MTKNKEKIRDGWVWCGCGNKPGGCPRESCTMSESSRAASLRLPPYDDVRAITCPRGHRATTIRCVRCELDDSAKKVIFHPLPEPGTPEFDAAAGPPDVPYARVEHSTAIRRGLFSEISAAGQAMADGISDTVKKIAEVSGKTGIVAVRVSEEFGLNLGAEPGKPMNLMTACGLVRVEVELPGVTNDRQLIQKLDDGIDRVRHALGFAPGGVDFTMMVDAIRRLKEFADSDVLTELEKTCARLETCVAAFHERIARYPLLRVLWHRPWRSRHRPRWGSLREVVSWLVAAHDCGDPSVACTCAGGFRFPNETSED